MFPPVEGLLRKRFSAKRVIARLMISPNYAGIILVLLGYITLPRPSGYCVPIAPNPSHQPCLIRDREIFALKHSRASTATRMPKIIASEAISFLSFSPTVTACLLTKLSWLATHWKGLVWAGPLALLCSIQNCCEKNTKVEFLI